MKGVPGKIPEMAPVDGTAGATVDGGAPPVGYETASDPALMAKYAGWSLPSTLFDDTTQPCERDKSRFSEFVESFVSRSLVHLLSNHFLCSYC